MYCVNCGTEINENNKFCGNCGNGIKSSVKEETQGNVIRLVRVNENDTKTKSEKSMEDNLAYFEEQERYANKLLKETLGHKQEKDLDYIMNEHKVFAKFRLYLIIGVLLSGPLMIFTCVPAFFGYELAYLSKYFKLIRRYKADLGNVSMKDFLKYIKSLSVKDISIIGHGEDYIEYMYKNNTKHRFYVDRYTSEFYNKPLRISIKQYIRSGLHVNRSLRLTHMVRTNIIFNYHFERYLKLKEEKTE